MTTISEYNSVQIHDNANRVLIMSNTDSEWFFLFDKKIMLDSEAFKYAMCEADPGEEFTVKLEPYFGMTALEITALDEESWTDAEISIEEPDFPLDYYA